MKCFLFRQRVGVTATLPDEVPIFLLSEESGSMEWNYVNLSVYHNRIKLYSDLPYLRDLKPHQRVGLLLTTSGDLHVFLDGRHIKKVPSEGLKNCYCVLLQVLEHSKKSTKQCYFYDSSQTASLENFL